MASSSAYCAILCGPSGSGKTQFALRIALDFPVVFVVNGDKADFVGRKFTHIDYDDIPKYKAKLQKSLLIFEDVINPNAAKMLVLKNALLYTKRHNNVNILLLMHSITTNNTYQLLQHADRLIFTHSNVNCKNFLDFVRFFRLQKNEMLTRWNDFMKQTRLNIYLVCNVHSSQFEYMTTDAKESLHEAIRGKPRSGSNSTDSRGGGSSGSGSSSSSSSSSGGLARGVRGLGAGREESGSDASAARKRAKVFCILSAYDNSAIMMALYDHIFSNFAIEKLNATDLSLTVTNLSANGKESKVSICDIIYGVINANVQPSRECRAAFRILRSQFSIPDLFIRNKHFR